MTKKIYLESLKSALGRSFSHYSFIYKQRVLHEQEIMQSFPDYKFYGIEQSHFRHCSVKNVKNNYRKKIRSFLPVVQFVTG